MSHQSLTSMCPFTLKIEWEDCRYQNMGRIVNFAFRVLIRFRNRPTWPTHWMSHFEISDPVTRVSIFSMLTQWDSHRSVPVTSGFYLRQNPRIPRNKVGGRQAPRWFFLGVWNLRLCCFSCRTIGGFYLCGTKKFVVNGPVKFDTTSITNIPPESNNPQLSWLTHEIPVWDREQNCHVSEKMSVSTSRQVYSEPPISVLAKVNTESEVGRDPLWIPERNPMRLTILVRFKRTSSITSDESIAGSHQSHSRI